jgi:hypothetical protein
VSAFGPLVMKVLLPLRIQPSPSGRALDFMPPKASDPESGSVIAQAPILSMVSRSRPQRSFCSTVPRFMMVPPASPRDTPMAVTRPGETLHSSTMGKRLKAALLSPLSVFAGGSAPAFSLAIRDLNELRAMSAMPKVV